MTQKTHTLPGRDETFPRDPPQKKHAIQSVVKHVPRGHFHVSVHGVPPPPTGGGVAHERAGIERVMGQAGEEAREEEEGVDDGDVARDGHEVGGIVAGPAEGD
eukprot:CAMPEP_0172480378 /NCGR_PEP_ID=MMETSP1066-20121228/5474_1 /TAXON_ID=671091 /ORGANISM="Coscinodiscus wailesii, Strain CCMP2513" /LENGTH=102 /DNA_ID=CAMNT_0013241609 /DNA_START=486 /DNA_END=797 /DNA_ORIENTATION=+